MIAERVGKSSTKPALAKTTATKSGPAKSANGHAKAPAKKSGGPRQPKGGKTT
jgi:hypothetical protein